MKKNIAILSMILSGYSYILAESPSESNRQTLSLKENMFTLGFHPNYFAYNIILIKPKVGSGSSTTAESLFQFAKDPHISFQINYENLRLRSHYSASQEYYYYSLECGFLMPNKIEVGLHILLDSFNESHYNSGMLDSSDEVSQKEYSLYIRNFFEGENSLFETKYQIGTSSFSHHEKKSEKSEENTEPYINTNKDMQFYIL